MSITIFSGQQKTFKLKLRVGTDKEPYDLSNFDKYKVCLPTNNGKLEITEVANANGSVVSLSGSAESGNLEVVVSYLDSPTLAIGDRQDIGVVVDNDSTPNPQPMLASGILDVKESPC